MGTGCFFNRKALHGYDPPLEPQCCRFSWGRARKKYFADGCGYAPTLYLESNNLSIYNMELSSLEMENPSLFLSLNQFFGQSPTLVASIIVKDDRFSTSATREDLLKEAIHVISCDYEENTAWGREVIACCTIIDPIICCAFLLFCMFCYSGSMLLNLYVYKFLIIWKKKKGKPNYQ